MIRAGQLRESVTFQRQVQQESGSGAKRASWQDYATDVPAEITTLSASQDVTENQPRTVSTHRIKIRYLDGLNDTFRILAPDYGTGLVLLIRSVIDPTGRRAEMVIEAAQTLPRK